jgi:hypothetical protein
VVPLQAVDLSRVVLDRHAAHARPPSGTGNPRPSQTCNAGVGIAASVHIVPAHNFAICVATNSDYKEIGEPLREVKEFLARRVMAMRHKGKGK